jgi:Outer membrane protein beta-barrel domain
MSTRGLLTAAAVVIILVASAAAQKNELAGIVGRTFISDQGINGATFDNPFVHFGNAVTFQANYSRYLMSGGITRLSFEVPFAFSPDVDLNSGTNAVPENYKFFFVTPSARVNIFANTRVSPWISGGGGYGRFAESSDALYFGSNTGQKGTNTGVVQYGAGLDVRVWTKFSIRGEFRDFWSGTPHLNVDTGKSRQHNFFVGAGIVWHFGKS